MFIFYFQRLEYYSNTLSQIIYVLKDGEKSFKLWKPKNRNGSLYINTFMSARNVLFGKSEKDRSFFFIDRDLKIYSTQIYYLNTTIIPSDYDPSYIIKIINKNDTVI
ncbi:hypothetical protein RF11_13505 [Thelohanellus kitauei]|uniref:Uncharacterized protein n=1 Tax=Thelohanellus kitauei TaxID=669202 RepID=A0A0C2N8M2_THEKT|nr:hypothetical protein RF11_13505 [Thelohanellus kitauei]